MSAYHFWSETCGPCKTIKPMINDLKEEFDTLTWISVDIKNDPNNYAGKYKVTHVPTVVVDSHKGVHSHSGTQVNGYYRILRIATH